VGLLGKPRLKLPFVDTDYIECLVILFTFFPSKSRAVCIIICYFLIITFGNQPCFVSYDRVHHFIKFVLKNSFGADDFMAGSSSNKFPTLIIFIDFTLLPS
jgi:hypothetical protein